MLLGKGDGTFDMQRTFPTGTAPQAMTVRDFDGDGVQDLFTANASVAVKSYTATFLRGDGKGAFTATNYTTGFVAYGVTGADMNGDTKMDLVLSSYYESALYIYLGAGDGTFSTTKTVATATNPGPVQTADLDGDGKPDLVTTLQWWLDAYRGQGDGTFFRSDQHDMRSKPRSLALADLDGDGRVDAVTSVEQTRTVTVLQGLGNGTFSEGRDFTVADPPAGLALADFNGDGHRDVAVAQGASNAVRVPLTHCGP